MSRKSEGFAEYSFAEYPQPAQPAEINYADPRFYAPQQQDQDSLPGAPDPFVADSLDQLVRPGPQGEVGQMDPYRGPAGLENYTADVGAEQREAAQDGQVRDGSKRKKRLASLGGLIAALVGLLIKFKTLMIILLDIKWVAFLGKFGLASISALISVAIYSRLFGWGFAIGLVALLFIHELGHAVVMRLKGIPVGAMVFIPMLGAAVFMRRMPRSARDEAEVGIAGPVAGALASLACLLIAYSAINSSGAAGVWGPLAYFGCFMNLFNLIPIVPFDGGRVLAAVDRRIWIIGFFGLIAIQIWQWLTGNSSIWLLIFIVIAATDFWARRHTRNSPGARAYYTVPLGERIMIGLAYFALAAALVMGMTLAHNLMFF